MTLTVTSKRHRGQTLSAPARLNRRSITINEHIYNSHLDSRTDQESPCNSNMLPRALSYGNIPPLSPNSGSVLSPCHPSSNVLLSSQEKWRRKSEKPYWRVRRPMYLFAALCALTFMCYTFFMSISSATSSKQDASLRRLVRQWQQQAANTASPSHNTNNVEFWENRHDVVHVVETRFMQSQPHLVALGLARLKLFAAFTLPSLLAQTSQEFLWIIRTDPDLSRDVLQELLYLVAPYPNFVVVGSNLNARWFDDVTVDTVWTNNIKLIMDYREAAKSHVLLETRLDADDALLYTFCAAVQVLAAAHLHAPVTTDISSNSHNNQDAQDADTIVSRSALIRGGDSDSVASKRTDQVSVPSQETQSGESSWLVWCAGQHLEWQFESPWKELNITKWNGIERGSLLGVQEKMCITPGLTWGFEPGVNRDEITVPKHHAKLHKLLPKCNFDKGRSHKCLDHIIFEQQVPMALRARTPTSAGMQRVFTGYDSHLANTKSRMKQNDLWGHLPVLFGITAETIWNARSYIEANLPSIVEDAVKGQCTKGHSCKKGSTEVLYELLNKTESS